MRLGVVILPELAWSDAEPLWRRAEALGFEHAWTYDHLAWRSFRDQPWYAALPVLTAAAMATERIKIGTLVASPNFRHPLPLAKELIALDDISAGRVIAGIGSGGVGWDATMLGHPAWSPRERADRFEEFVTLVDLLLREPAVSWQGRYYAVDEARTHPGCVQRPRLPLAIAATGRRALRLAARYGDVWVTTGPSSNQILSVEDGPAFVAEQIRRLEEACQEVGRDPASLGRLVLTGPNLDPGLHSPAAFRSTAARYEEVGVTDLVVHWPRASDPYAGDIGVLEQIAPG